jgi:hypothetical protein
MPTPYSVGNYGSADTAKRGFAGQRVADAPTQTSSGDVGHRCLLLCEVIRGTITHTGCQRVITNYAMRIHELLAGHLLHETDQDDPGLGPSTPLATIAAAPGAAPLDQEFALTGLSLCVG